jgi:hypothetical protein
LLATGRNEEAVKVCRELLAQWQLIPLARGIETAAAESMLARACLAAGNLAQAEQLAEKSLDILNHMQHPEGSRALITLSLVRQLPHLVRPALPLIVDSPSLTHAEKARFLEQEAARLTAHGFSYEAAMLSGAAAEQWSQLGIATGDDPNFYERKSSRIGLNVSTSLALSESS